MFKILGLVFSVFVVGCDADFDPSSPMTGSASNSWAVCRVAYDECRVLTTMRDCDVCTDACGTATSTCDERVLAVQCSDRIAEACTPALRQCLAPR